MQAWSDHDTGAVQGPGGAPRAHGSRQAPAASRHSQAGVCWLGAEYRHFGNNANALNSEGNLLLTS